MVYDSHILCIHLVYTMFILVLVWIEEMLRNKIQNFHHNLAPACTYNCQGGRHLMNPRKALFTELVHMTGKYQVYVCHIWSTARFLAVFGFCTAPGRFRPGLSAHPFGFCDRKPADSRLGPAKVPQPGVDLVYVTAPARSLA